MFKIQKLPPLLFRTDFPGYRGLQYVHNFLVFWVILNFFKCQKSHYSRHGLPVNSHANFTYSFPTLKIILIPTITRSNHFWFISLIAHTGPPMPETLILCGIDLLVARHTSKTLLALLNHSFWGVHISGRNQSFTSWGVHIAGRNWAFSSAVEKLSRHCPGMEYQHKRGYTSNILCRIQKNYCCQCCIEICWDITLQQGEQRQPQMVRWTLGDFHIDLQLPPSHIPRSQFQQKIVQEIIHKLGPTQIILFEPPGEVGMPKRRVLAIKQSIKELWHVTYFTDFIIHRVRWAQCCNLQGHWIQAT